MGRISGPYQEKGFNIELKIELNFYSSGGKQLKSICSVAKNKVYA